MTDYEKAMKLTREAEQCYERAYCQVLAERDALRACLLDGYALSVERMPTIAMEKENKAYRELGDRMRDFQRRASELIS